MTAIFLAIAWWCGKQFDRAKYYSEKDPLTNTYNRRTLERSFRKLAATCKKEEKKLGIIMLDLNNFKEINDSFGHQIGDEVLVHVASILEDFRRKDDWVARWGGDEFVILVPDCQEDFKSVYIEGLLQKLKGGNVDNLPVIGASIGGSVYPDDGERLQELLRMADGAMYKAKEMKEGGRF
nr:GGDEF domain-containing protein [Sporosarcina sp. ACRSM]